MGCIAVFGPRVDRDPHRYTATKLGGFTLHSVQSSVGASDPPPPPSQIKKERKSLGSFPNTHLYLPVY